MTKKVNAIKNMINKKSESKNPLRTGKISIFETIGSVIEIILGISFFL